MISLVSILSEMDHGTLADLVGDVKIVELISEVSRTRLENLDSGSLILQILGGPRAILESPKNRKTLFLYLSGENRTALAAKLKVTNLDNVKLTDERRALIYEFFECSQQTDDSSELEKPPSAEILSPDYSLFPHQNVALQETQTYLHSSNDPKVMLHMPTGSGKTRTAMHIVSQALNASSSGVVVWLVAGKELCQQASEEFEAAWKSLGGRSLPLIRLWSDVGDPKLPPELEPQFLADRWPLSLTDGLIVGSVDTLRNIVTSWEAKDRIERRKHIKLVVFDEAHRSVATTYSEIINCITDQSTPLLGLSATPGRRHHGGDKDLDEALVSMFSGQKVVLKIPGYNSPIDALIDMGYLARLKKEQLNIANELLNRSQLAEIQNNLETLLDLPPHLLRVFGLSATRNLQIVNRVEKLIKDEGHCRVIVFAPSVESSIVIANVLAARGVRSESITNVTPSAVRSRAVSEYKSVNKTPFVLTNYGVLTTGFDAPQTSAVVVARPTTSIVLLNQMAGRAIRGPNVKGNAEALLITVVDTQVPELVETNRQFHAFDDSWKAIEEDQ